MYKHVRPIKSLKNTGENVKKRYSSQMNVKLADVYQIKELHIFCFRFWMAKMLNNNKTNQKW